MPEYRVLFTPDAESEIFDSWVWGVSVWGSEAAENWLRELHVAVFERLTTFPFSCSLAPETVEFGSEIRQFIYGRYRLLFVVDGDAVIVLHLVGPFHL